MPDPVANKILELNGRLDDPIGFMMDAIKHLGFTELPGIAQHGIDHMAWYLLNTEAIRMLRDGEQFQCKDRAEALAAHYDEFDPEALPADYQDRLLRLFSRTRNRASQGVICLLYTSPSPRDRS